MSETAAEPTRTGHAAFTMTDVSVSFGGIVALSGVGLEVAKRLGGRGRGLAGMQLGLTPTSKL